MIVFQIRSDTEEMVLLIPCFVIREALLTELDDSWVGTLEDLIVPPSCVRSFSYKRFWTHEPWHSNWWWYCSWWKHVVVVGVDRSPA